MWPQDGTQGRVGETKFIKLIGPREIVTACHEKVTWQEHPGVRLHQAGGDEMGVTTHGNVLLLEGQDGVHA